MSMLMMTGCSHKITPTVEAGTQGAFVSPQTVPETGRVLSSTPVDARPSVIVYKMRDDYANLVPVTLDQNGNIVSYPDPVDITDSCKPVALGDGWYLDRRGVSPNSAFTNYTYDQYHALERVPSLETLKEHIIARHAIVGMWDCGKDDRSIDELKQLVKDGFPGCKSVIKTLVFDN